MGVMDASGLPMVDAFAHGHDDDDAAFDRWLASMTPDELDRLLIKLDAHDGVSGQARTA